MTKKILDCVQEAITEEKDSEDVRSTFHNWVSVLHEQVQCYNQTPKNITKKTPWEVHFPENMGKMNSLYMTSESHASILEEENEEVRIYNFLKISVITNCFCFR